MNYYVSECWCVCSFRISRITYVLIRGGFRSKFYGNNITKYNWHIDTTQWKRCVKKRIQKGWYLWVMEHLVLGNWTSSSTTKGLYSSIRNDVPCYNYLIFAYSEAFSRTERYDNDMIKKKQRFKNKRTTPCLAQPIRVKQKAEIRKLMKSC